MACGGIFIALFTGKLGMTSVIFYFSIGNTILSCRANETINILYNIIDFVNFLL